MQFRKALFALCLASLVAGCAGKTQAPEANPIPQDNIKGPGLFSGDSGDILSAFRSKNAESGGMNIGVNGYLWRAALETISFLPITQADSAGGVILTDWYANPKTPTERLRMNVFIKGKELRTDGIAVKVFKQKKMDGEWRDVAVAESTERKLEDTILTRARELRVADKAAK